MSETEEHATKPDSRRFVHEVDSDDRIRSVNADWEAFARENGAPELTAATVVGRPLLDFITGDELQQLHLMLMLRVRVSTEPVDLPFRCDGPRQRRWMRLRISPLADGGLRFEGRIERRAFRDAVPLFDRDAPHSLEEFVTVCSWCKRMLVGEEWVEVEVAVERLALFEREPMPGLTHGICSSCVPVLYRPGEDLPDGPVNSAEPGPNSEPA